MFFIRKRDISLSTINFKSYSITTVVVYRIAMKGGTDHGRIQRALALLLLIVVAVVFATGLSYRGILLCRHQRRIYRYYTLRGKSVYNLQITNDGESKCGTRLHGGAFAVRLPARSECYFCLFVFLFLTLLYKAKTYLFFVPFWL